MMKTKQVFTGLGINGVYLATRQVGATLHYLYFDRNRRKFGYRVLVPKGAGVLPWNASYDIRSDRKISKAAAQKVISKGKMTVTMVDESLRQCGLRII